jgi:hypothetical protein
LAPTDFLGLGIIVTPEETFALHEGPLTLVQPLLVTGVLFALLASRFVGGPKVGLVDMRWAAVLVAALAVFLTTATPSSQPARDIDTGPALAALVFSLPAIGACLMVARNCRHEVTATAFGVAAGIALAGSAALMKVCTDLMAHGVANLLSAWQLYALILVGGSALVLSQLAYRAGPMTASVPAINSVNPLASVMIGWAVFDESFRVGTAAVAVEVLSLGLVVAATAILSLGRPCGRGRPSSVRRATSQSERSRPPEAKLVAETLGTGSAVRTRILRRGRTGFVRRLGVGPPRSGGRGRLVRSFT